MSKHLAKQDKKIRKMKWELFWSVSGYVIVVVGVVREDVIMVLLGLYLVFSPRLDAIEREIEELKDERISTNQRTNTSL